jgi:hypothetical protein
MEANKKIGRWVGVLLLVQLGLVMAGFIFVKPGVGLDYLEVASAVAPLTRAAVLILIAASVTSLWAAVMAFPVIREYSVRAAILLVAVSVIWIVLQAIDGAFVYSMMSLSDRSVEAAGSSPDIYRVVGTGLRSTRNAVHYNVLLALDVWFVVFAAVLLSYRIVPRWVAGIALIGAVVHVFAIPMSMFAGYTIFWPGAFSMAVVYLVLGGWLVAKGMRDEGRASE